MIRKPIDPMDLASTILKALPEGILLTTKAGGKLDTMTIGWGFLGWDWGLPIFEVLVRDTRYTKVLLDESGEFTINVPLPEENRKKIIGYCGTVSGRDHNKFQDMDLHTVPGEKVSAPAIAEFPITLECKVIYTQRQDTDRIPEESKKRYYPTGNYHTAYMGQIVSAYILEDE